MLYKKIRILKGKYGDGVLKTTFLEGGYTRIELSLPFKSGQCAIVAEGYSEVAELENGKLDRSLPYQALSPQVAVRRDDEVYGDLNDECLSLLFPSPKEEGPLPAESLDEVSEALTVETPQEKSDIAVEYGAIELAPEIIEKEDDDFLADFEKKYASSPREETLEALSPDSKWIASEDGKTAVGILYNSSGATHVCYAEKGVREEPPSYEAEWLDGYWIVYNEIDS